MDFSDLRQMKAKVIFLEFILGLLLISCSPSEASISTAIAKTQAAQPTPTPNLYISSGQEFLPKALDMPTGFEVEVTSSGPIDNGLGYNLIFNNPGNILLGKSFMVMFITKVPETIEDAKDIYNQISNWSGFPDVTKTGNMEVNIPGVDDSIGTMGSYPVPMPDSLGVGFSPSACSITLRESNLILVVFVTTLGDNEACIKDAKYFTSLTLPNFSNR